jgi:predicted  nucleic acid-binding Zn-ribbon protein
VEFTYPHSTGGYGCKTPGSMAGKYYSASDYNRLSDELKILKEEHAKLKEEKEALKDRIQHILDDISGILINHVDLK